MRRASRPFAISSLVLCLALTAACGSAPADPSPTSSVEPPAETPTDPLPEEPDTAPELSPDEPEPADEPLPDEPLVVEPPAEPPPVVAEDRMAWWREARFGLFLHWGLYAIPAGEWGEGKNHAEWILTTAQIPVAKYEEFVGQFDPVDFDADAWVRMAKRAGMKYIVITSKHHDGFCLFDSAHTDYDVMSTPFRRDILAELAEACQREGLKMCWYHSIMDWHHSDYLPRRGWESRSAEGADLDRYVAYMRAQVEELLTNYGEIGVMWFDGEWEGSWSHERGVALYDLCRRLQPDVIVNNRVDKGRSGMAGMTSDERFAGDFGTPEQEIPATGLPGVDWETCMTMNRHWGYNRHDQDWKSTADLVRKLVDIASKGGNFLLNVGPTAEGRFPEASIQRLEEIGQWMDVHAESIRGTGASPFADLPWGRCTARRVEGGTRLYLHVFDWPADGRLVVPELGNEPVRAYLLARPEPALSAAQENGSVAITVPAEPLDPIDTVVVLEVEGEPIVFETPRIVADSDQLLDALEVELAVRSSELSVRFTLDGTEPTTASPRYVAPIRLTEGAVVRARSFHGSRPVASTAMRRFTKVAPWSALRPGESRPGLLAERFVGTWDVIPDFDALTPEETWTAEKVSLRKEDEGEYCGLRMRGLLEVPATALYVFRLTSDDGSRLRIDGRLVADNDGLHSTAAKRGVAPLAAGLHEIEIEWFNKTGGAVLDLELGRVGEELRPVYPRALRHRTR